MRAPYQYLVPLLSLFLTRVDLTDIYPLKIPVKILKVVDADTVHAQSGSYFFKIRLSKIDSPEKSQPFVGARSSLDAGDFARNCFMKVLAKQKLLTLRLERFDIYGRILGDFDRDLSLRLIEAGCSGLYPYAEFQSRKEKSLYLKALAHARETRRGLWAFGGYELPKNWRKKNQRFFRKRSGHLLSRR